MLLSIVRKGCPSFQPKVSLMIVASSALKLATFSSVFALCFWSAQARAQSAGTGGTTSGGTGGTASPGGSGGAPSAGGMSSGGSGAVGGSTAAGGMSSSAGGSGGMRPNLVKKGNFHGTATHPWGKKP